MIICFIKLKNYNKVKENEKWKTRIPELKRSAQVATAWAIAKGTLPIIGVTKVRQVEEAAKAAQIELTADEISRLERLGDETGVHTLREWEKEM